jgi:hypothetical protein
MSCKELFLRWEPLRMLSTAPTEMASSLLLVVAIQHYHADLTSKILIASCFTIGFLLSPSLVFAVQYLGISVSHALAGIHVLAAAGMLLIGFTDGVEWLIAGAVLSLGMLAAGNTLVTALWRESLAADVRGVYYGNISKFSLIYGLVVGLLVSWWVGSDITRFHAVTIALSCSYLAGAWASFQIPSSSLSSRRDTRFQLRSFSILRRDKAFTVIIVAWYLVGLANLTSRPLRAEYVGGEYAYVQYSPFAIMVLIEVVPSLFRVVTMPFWGRAFDKMEFLVMRVALNTAFGLSIILFFVPSLWCQVLASILFGVARGGSHIAWGLWVTKYAPEQHTADYMAVHTFLTGTRGLLGSSIGLAALGIYSFGAISIFCFALTCASTLIVLLLLRANRTEAYGKN